MWDHHFNLRVDGGSAAARARIEAEPESLMGAALRAAPLGVKMLGNYLPNAAKAAVAFAKPSA